MYADKADQISDWTGKYDIEDKRMTGFIAQEVAQAANDINYEFSGVNVTENENDLSSLSYAEFVVPLVKAVQEQQQMIDKQNIIINQLLNRIEKLENY